MGPLGTNALYGYFEDKFMRLCFEYGMTHEDYAALTNAPHYRSHEERIAGRRARIVEFYYSLTDPPYYREIIAVDFPSVEGEWSHLHLKALCRTTNEYAKARTIFRTVRLKQ